MNIKQKLYINALVTTILAIIVVVALLYSSSKTEDIYTKATIAESAHSAVSELDILAYEYLLYREQRIEERWTDKYSAIKKILRKFPASDTDLLDIIESDFELLWKIFNEVTENYRKMLNLIETGASREKIDLIKQLEERLVGQLLIKSRSIITNTSRISEKLNHRHIRYHHLTNRIVISFTLLLSVTIIILSLFLLKSISSPLEKLSSGAAVIGKGDLDHRVDVVSNDEIGRLAMAFNRMVKNLKIVTASRDDLNLEIQSRKKLQEELIIAIKNAETAKEEAESANRLKSDFLANLSHEIRTPLNAVIGFSELLSGKTSDKTCSGYIQSIKTAGKTLLNLITDILDLSKIEAGIIDIEYDSANIRDIFNHLKLLFQIRFSEKNLDFIIEIDEDLPATVMIDEARLTQVLINIISNSLKFTDKGYVKLSAFEEKENDSDEFIRLIIRIEDTGIGIPEEEHELIFESFKQQSDQDTGDYGGTGLGLAISKKLIEMMNGKISVKSRKGKGSTFDIELNDVELLSENEKIKSDSSIDYTQIKFAGKKALVVDDNDSNKNLIVELLVNAGMEVETANNGKEALDKIRKFQPELVLLDIKMPVMNGFETIIKIRNNPDISYLPVIALTASATNESRKEIKDAGFNDYLFKPVNILKLFRKISNHLDYQIEDIADAEDDLEDYLDEKGISESIAENGELVHELITGTLPGIANQKHALKIKDAQRISEQLINTGEKYGNTTVRNLGKKLLYSTEGYDIRKIRKFLGMLESVLNKLNETGD